MDAPPNAQRAVAEFRRITEGITVVMVTTVADDGLFRSRPMLLERIESDGSLVFLTHLSSQKLQELQADTRISVTFVGDKGDRYVCAAGIGRFARNEVQIAELWNPT